MENQISFDHILIYLFFQGVGIDTFDPKQNMYPLVTGADAAKNSDTQDSAR